MHLDSIPSLLCCFLASTSLFTSTAFGAPFIKRQSGGPVIVSPGGVDDITLTEFNTLNGTNPNATFHGPPQPQAAAGLRLDLVNNYGSGTNVYITALDTSNRVIILTPSGQWYYPTSSSTTIPQAITENIAIPLGNQGQTTSLTLPDFFISGRVYFAAGNLQFYTLETASGGVTLVSPDPQNPSDPSASIFWGFAEMTYTQAGGLYADMTFVDFVGMPVGMQLTTTDGSGTQTVRGVAQGAVSTVCNDLAPHASQDGQPWDQLCQYAQTAGGSSLSPLRANAPGKYIAVHGDAFSNYYTSYVQSVWARYASETLTIHSQNAALGDIPCSTASGALVCEGASRSIPQPSALDIFGCQGVFGTQAGDNDVMLAVVPRLCAALQRTTLLLAAGGNVQPGLPATDYYTTSPTNWYSQAVHSVELDGRGYAFAFDDVNPDGAPDASGAVASANPAVWTLFVGGS
ncbi:hypothetical protein PV08_07245 [Exophiala spinifera]|uniref:GH64 domain-containing protein n=1 Tax=Exophiala spinifera TaxID=91928 RepID=A0A0D1YHR5_9EURO|nr:uncharacterized protein PV08_07245 [Exophiala spinifera]KIW14461.1 hypothetical protein PV08_07245 [Exophiala spinifera]